MFEYINAVQLLPAQVYFLTALMIGGAVGMATNQFKSKKICGNRTNGSEVY